MRLAYQLHQAVHHYFHPFQGNSSLYRLVWAFPGNLNHLIKVGLAAFFNRDKKWCYITRILSLIDFKRIFSIFTRLLMESAAN